MSKFFIFIVLVFLVIDTGLAQVQETEEINKLINNWHSAAATCDSVVFFDSMTDDAIYIGTDASERWTKAEFSKFAMPYFRKGKAWDFKPIERAVYFSNVKKVAWFNETLNTWMGVCRSSGVVVYNKKTGWKIAHYHLSVTVPNEKIKQFIELTKE